MGNQIKKQFTLDMFTSGRWDSIAQFCDPDWSLIGIDIVGIRHAAIFPDDTINHQFDWVPQVPQCKQFYFFLEKENVIIATLEVNLAKRTMYWAHGYANKVYDWYHMQRARTGKPVVLGDKKNQLLFEVDFVITQERGTNVPKPSEEV